MGTKTILSLGLAAMSLVAFGQSQPTADDLMSKAKAVAKQENKAVWIIFHASW